MTSIDFLIPVASDSRYLWEAVSSLRKSINNSRVGNDCKIIIINNAVLDADFLNKLEILSSTFQAQAITFNGRLSILDNWNRCLGQGTGNYIHFLHDDDLVTSDYVCKLFQCLSRKKLVLSSYSYFEDDEPQHTWSGLHDSLHSQITKEEYTAYLCKSFFHISAVCFERNGCGIFNTELRFNADQDFIRSLAYKHGYNNVTFLSGPPLVLIRSHPSQDQKSNNISLFAAQNLCSINSRLIKQALNDGLSPSLLGLAFANDSPSAVRILSSYDIRWPPFKTALLYLSCLYHSAHPFKIAILLLTRIIFQRLVWRFKLRSVKTS